MDFCKHLPTKMNKRKCKNNTDIFCYVCGKFASQNLQKAICDKLKHAFKLYFGFN